MALAVGGLCRFSSYLAGVANSGNFCPSASAAIRPLCSPVHRATFSTEKVEGFTKFGKPKPYTRAQRVSDDVENDFLDNFTEKFSNDHMKVRGCEIPPQYEHYFSHPTERVKTERERQQLKAYERKERKKQNRALKIAAFEEGKVEYSSSEPVRPLRIGELIRGAIGGVLLEDLVDSVTAPIFRGGSVMITKVVVTRDLRHAKLYWSALRRVEEIRREFKRPDVVKRVRQLLARKLSHLKFQPELQFFHESEEFEPVNEGFEGVLDQIEEELGSKLYDPAPAPPRMPRGRRGLRPRTSGESSLFWDTPKAPDTAFTSS
eukprot:TRINITY_DN8725_c0_g1_i1.p1 TRINITY_DN8725_c0_g1~~TRINITY_DN8725_c0_g1_i1.p1  ORF type:complete len:318 (+),score=59.96 TRINITY_DN8725_c0_g1_i1:48-1001(+)